MDGKISFFELKYLINETFYYESCVNNYTYAQAAGISYEAFYGYIVGDGIESIVVRMELLKLKRRHDVNVKLGESDIKSMQYIVKRANEIDYSSLLNNREIEYFEEDLAVIKERLAGLENR